jgi:hypothetical protein
MEIDIIKMKILDRLNLDDEPINLIFKEIEVHDQNLKEPYKSIDTPEEEIRNSLKELIRNKYVRVFDEKGKEIEDYDINKVLSDDVPLWSIWFRLTELGEKTYYKKYDEFWVD